MEMIFADLRKFFRYLAALRDPSVKPDLPVQPGPPVLRDLLAQPDRKVPLVQPGLPVLRDPSVKPDLPVLRDLLAQPGLPVLRDPSVKPDLPVQPGPPVLRGLLDLKALPVQCWPSQTSTP